MSMALYDRLKGAPGSGSSRPTPKRPALVAVEGNGDSAHHELKSRVHNRLFDLIDLSRLGKVSEERVREDIAVATRRALDEERVLLNLEERERIVSEIQDEVFGLGPLEPLLQDPTVSDILVNGCKQVYVERHGRLEHTVARFKDDDHLMRIIEKIVSSVGRRVDEMTPMVDARLADGSRVNAIIPPLALDGPMLSIRRFGSEPLSADELVRLGTLTPELVQVLFAVVRARLNVLISGGTGTGKTTLLNMLSGFIPNSERIVTIEDSAELQLGQEHTVRLETRPANLEGKGQVSQRELVINSLRMRPDRIIVGEVRGSEALDMLQAMNTGHDGSLTTIHANSPRDALSRIETMVAMTGLDLPQRAVRQQIASAIQVVIQVARLSDGRRRLVSLQEITGIDGDVIGMQEIFRLDRHGLDEEGNARVELGATGIRPRFTDKLKLVGLELPKDLFDRKGQAPSR
jgi:pilus assembly protein CpaF